jgi:DNA-binding MarR family transcriptional regulator
VSTQTLTSRQDTLRDLEREVGVLIRRVKRVIGQRARAVDPELQPPSYLMLGWLVDRGPVRASVMAEEFAIDKGAISRQLQHLVDLGLVDRSPDPADGRASLVAASEHAVRRLEQVADARRHLLEERLDEWSAEDLTQFAELLGRYNRTLNASESE